MPINLLIFLRSSPRVDFNRWVISKLTSRESLFSQIIKELSERGVMMKYNRIMQEDMIKYGIVIFADATAGESSSSTP